MTQALAIIEQAHRESNLIALKGATLTPEQVAEGLGKLNTLLASVYGFEAGSKLHDWPVGISTGTQEMVSSWTRGEWQYPPQNSRLLAYSTDAEIVYLPPFPDNGARIGVIDIQGQISLHPLTLNANGKLIEDVFTVDVDQDEFGGEWMYRADTANWYRLTGLLEDTEMPFPVQFDDYFETMLAARLNPRYGRAMTAETTAALQRSLAQMRATYRQRREVRAPAEVLNMPDIGQGGGWDDSVPPRRGNTTWMR